MRKLVFILTLVLCVLENHAAELVWYNGSVVLRSQQVLKGQISMQHGYDAILFRAGDSLMVYPAGKIESVFYYDEEANINRKFTVIQQKVNAFTTSQLYEIVVVGEISVLRKINSVLADKRDDRNSYDYFIRKGKETFGIHQFRKHIFPLLGRSCDSLEKFVEEVHLDPNDPADAIRIIQFYNKEIRAKIIIARN